MSGTLSECTINGGIVTASLPGVGITANPLTFISAAPTPAPMAQINGRESDCDALLDDIAEEIAHWFGYITNEDYAPILREYERLLYRRTGEHKYRDKDGDFKAEYDSILPNGHLLLRRTDGTLSEYEFKEVKFVIPNL